MKKRMPKAFTLVELLIAISILFAVIIISVGATIALNTNYKVLMSYLTSSLKGREAIEAISKDCRMAARVLDSYAGYTTTDSSIVLKVPSIDASGQIIDVNKYFDYIIYRVVNGDLWKIVMPYSGSSRAPHNGVIKEPVESLHIESKGTALSQIPHKSVITSITVWVSINENILGKDYRIIPGTTIKLMNYEWEYVR